MGLMCEKNRTIVIVVIVRIIIVAIVIVIEIIIISIYAAVMCSTNIYGWVRWVRK